MFDKIDGVIPLPLMNIVYGSKYPIWTLNVSSKGYGVIGQTLI